MREQHCKTRVDDGADVKRVGGELRRSAGAGPPKTGDLRNKTALWWQHALQEWQNAPQLCCRLRGAPQACQHYIVSDESVIAIVAPAAAQRTSYE